MERRELAVRDGGRVARPFVRRVCTAFGQYRWSDEFVAKEVWVPGSFLVGSDVEVSWNLHEFCLQLIGEEGPDYDFYYLCDGEPTLRVTSDGLARYLRRNYPGTPLWRPRHLRPGRGGMPAPGGFGGGRELTGKVRWFTVFAKYDSSLEFMALPQWLDESLLGGTEEEISRNLHEFCLQFIGMRAPDFDFYYLAEGRSSMLATWESLRGHVDRRKGDALAAGEEDRRLIELLLGPMDDLVYDVAIGG